jgi:hypothetical protein
MAVSEESDGRISRGFAKFQDKGLMPLVVLRLLAISRIDSKCNSTAQGVPVIGIQRAAP